MNGLSREMIIHPGETLKEVLEDREMSQQELALRTGVTPKHISTVLSGKKNISVSFAKKLEYALDIDAEFWMNLQNLYDKELFEFDELHSISQEEINIFKSIKDIFKYITEKKFIPAIKQIEQNILELRKYINVSSLTSIPSLVSSGAFRAQTTMEYNPYILFTWQKICESLSDEIETETLDYEDQMEKLISICPKIKSLSLLPQKDFLQRLQKYFSTCGIAFVIAPQFKGAPVQGFIKTRQDGKTIICMTFRQCRADIFWFTLFHEIGHFINGDSKQKFIDFESSDNAKERKANIFAQNYLIEKTAYQDFIKTNDFSLQAIKHFAESQNVLPTIVIGRLQNEKHLNWSDFSGEIVRYEKM